MSLDSLDWILALGALAIAFLAIGKLVHKVWSEIHEEWIKFKEVLESYLGRPATAYYPEEPSIPSRMARNEEILVKLSEQADTNAQRLFTIEKQIFPDGGGSLADDLKEIKTDLKEAAKERTTILKASNKIRDQWAERLGVADLPDSPELRKYDSL